MGLEAECRATFRGQTATGKVLLETDALIFRGGFRLAIPYRTMESVDAKDGQLIVTFPDGQATFDLGPKAEKWLDRIRNPKGIMDKLGVKSGAEVSLLGSFGSGFGQELTACGAKITQGRPARESDFIFLFVNGFEELKEIDRLQDYLQPKGAIWVIYPKGQQHIRESDVLKAGKQARLVDTKVARFSDTHTALKFVIPLARR